MSTDHAPASGGATQPVLTRTPRDAARVAAYLLRDMVRRIPKGTLGRDRERRLPRELADFLVPAAVAERSALGWYRAVCDRVGSDPTEAGHEGGYPAVAWLPEGRVRWDRALASVELRHLRLAVHESPDLFATFATSAPIEGEEALFDAFVYDESPRARAALPSRLIAPRQHRTVWTQTAPSAHGADTKSGNVSMFRRQRVVDARTGEHALVPFISGNGVRGGWRDRVFGRYLALLGLRPEDLPARTRAHAMLAGGTIDAGADTATVDVLARRRARACCPPWDLLAGCVDSQIMSGAARVNDAILVCRENAWLVRHAVGDPGEALDDLAARLPEAASLTTLRLLTRHAHRDLPDADGSQMRVNTELVIPGARWVHSVSVYRLDGVSEVTASCLADLLTDWRDDPYVGAGSARGYGSIAFDPYVPGDGVPDLPPPRVYLDWLAAHRDEARAWALGEPDPHAPAVETGVLPGPGAKRGRGKAARTAAPTQPAPAEIPFEDAT